MNYRKILNKIHLQYPNYSDKKQAEYAELLMNADERLQPNIEEWLDDKPLSEIWIREKYCIRAVMQIRQDNDFIDAIAALNEYAKNAFNEYLIWRQRA